MNQSEIEFLNVLSNSIWKPNDLVFEGVDWKEIYSEAQAHAVTGFVQMPSYYMEPIKYELMTRFIHYTIEEEKLIDLFNLNHISFVIIKGSAAAVYYLEPYRRSMGDFDIIVSENQFYEAIEILKLNGYEQKEIFEGYQREIHFVKDGMIYELHYHFSDADFDVEKYIIEGLEHVVLGRIEDHLFPMLPPLANGIVLLAHLRHHLLTGLGLRQVVDWMMYCDKVLDDLFWEKEFKYVCEDNRLKKLAVNITFLCQKYLGLKSTITWCREADEELCDKLMDFIMLSGNFGYKNGSGKPIENVSTYLMQKGFFHYLQKAGEHNWNAYHRYMFLRPFCWLYQVFRYICQGIRLKHINELTDDVFRGRQRYYLLKKLDLD